MVMGTVLGMLVFWETGLERMIPAGMQFHAGMVISGMA